MSANALFTGVVAIVPTRRRRFFWAAWWTNPPVADPFCKPDAFQGGARSREDAQVEAEEVAGQRLVEIDGRWAGAWVRVQRGEAPWPKPKEERGERVELAAPHGSRAWALGVLGLPMGSSSEEVKRAFRSLALRTHPDRGGEASAFMDARKALDVALSAPNRRSRSSRK